MSNTNFFSLSLSKRSKFWMMLSALLACLLSWVIAFTQNPFLSQLESAPPSFAGLGVTVQFSSDTIAPGSTSRLTLSLSNTDAAPHSGVTLTNNLPANVTIADPAAASTDCNAILSVPDGGSTISLTNGRLGIGQTCSIALNVTGSAPGTHTNTTGNISSNSGTYTNGTDDLTVNGVIPTFSLVASPVKIAPGQTSRLTYTIDQTSYSSESTVAFSHIFPGGLEVASPPNFELDANCGTNTSASTSVSPGDTSFSFSVPLSFPFSGIQPNAICIVAFDVVATKTDVFQLETSDLLTTFPTYSNSGSAFAEIDASAQPFSKSFSANSVNKGDSVTLAYTISNFDRVNTLTALAFTDDMNAALSGLVATDLPKSDVCGSGSTLTGSGSIALAGGTLPAEGSCTFEVTLSVPAGAAGGTYTSTSSQLSGIRNSSPFTLDEAINTLTVAPSPQAEISFNPQTAIPGDLIDVTFTLTNTNDAAGASDMAFQFPFASVLVGATSSTLPANGFCGGASSLGIYVDPSFSDLVGWSLTSGELALGASCTFSATLQIPDTTPQGNYTIPLESFLAEVDSNQVAGDSNSPALTIVAPPQFLVEVQNNPHLPGDTAEIVYTIDYSGSDDNSPVAAATNISFTHDLSGSLASLVAVGLPLNDGCGSGSTLSGTSELTLTGGNLQPGETCIMTATVHIPADATMGSYALNTSQLSAEVGATPLTAPAVSPELEISALSFSTRFEPSQALANETVNFEYTITNLSNTYQATSMGFTHSLSSIISGMSTSSATQIDICGAGSQLTGSTSSPALTGGNLQPGESCAFSITVQVPNGSFNGDYNSLTSSLSGIVNSAAFIIDGAQTDLTIDSNRLGLEKTFIADTSNLPGVAQTLVYTITNTDVDNGVDSISFTDDLDAALTGLSAAGLPANDVCGSGSSISGTGNVTFASGSLAAGASCTFAISVTVPISAEAALYPSTSSNLTGEINGLAVDGTGAKGMLEVAQLTLEHRFATAGAPNTIVPLTVVISNTGLIDTINGVTFADSLDFTLAGLSAVNLPKTGICGPDSALTGGSTLTLSGASLRELSACSFEVDILLPADVPLNSYSHTIDALEQNGITISLPSTATLSIIRPEVSVANTITPTDLMPGEQITATLTYTNSGAGEATNIAITHPLPPEVSITSVITNGVTLTQTTVNGQSVLQQATIASGASHTITVTGVVSPALNSDGIITATTSITSTADVSTTNNSQPISFNLTVPKVSIAADSRSISVTEASGSVPITVTLDSTNPYAPVVLTYQTSDGTATNGSDFTGSTDGSVTIPAGSTSASFSIPILDDAVAEPAQTFTVTLSASLGGQITAAQTAVITITDTDVELPDSYEIYLPSISNSFAQAPDLVVDSVDVSGVQATVVVKNIGSRPVENGFWVDLIVDPSTPPIKPNDTAGSLAAPGLIWGIDGSDLPLLSGAAITLTVDGPYFVPTMSTITDPISAGTPVYVHVDSANIGTSYGSVQELHEITREPYNNILMALSSRRATIVWENRAVTGLSSDFELPIRPNEVK